MSVALYLSAIIFGLLLRRSKVVTLYISFVMYILAVYNYMNADYEAYAISYESIAKGAEFRYIGYSKLLQFFASRGFSFLEYRHAFFFICILLLIIAVWLLTEDINYVLSLYLIFSFPMDVVQMKTFISELFVLLGIALYIGRNNKTSSLDLRKACLSYIMLGIAALLHFSNVYYCVAFLVFILYQNREKYQERLMTLSGLMALLVYSGGMALLLGFAGKLGLIGNLEYLAQWTQKGTHLGFVLSFVLLALIVAASNDDNKGDLVNTEDKGAISRKQIRAFIYTSLLLAPVLILNVTFVRMLRLYMILVCVLFANIERKKIVTVQEQSRSGLFAFSIVYMFFYEIATMFSYTLGAIFNYNSFL